MLRKEDALDDFREKQLPDMKSFPFIVPQKLPVQGNIGERGNNEKIRNIACIRCRFQCPSNIFDPRCGVCGSEMLTVV